MTVTLPLANWISDHLTGVEAIAAPFGSFGISKHVLALFMVALLLVLTFVPFGAAIRSSVAPKGRLVNALEAVLLFLRDEVSRPFLGKEGDRFLPMIWTFFFFILYCNLLGLVPLPIPVKVFHAGHEQWVWFGTVTATGQITVTGALAGIAFLWYHGLGIKAQGLVPYIRHIVPSGIPLPLLPLIFVLEVAGHIVKPAALMVRLWANMTGGHAVLYAFLGFVFMFGLWLAPVTILGGLAVFLLEIFVAFLQAYVFTFLVVVFLGGALHPH